MFLTIPRSVIGRWISGSLTPARACVICSAVGGEETAGGMTMPSCYGGSQAGANGTVRSGAVSNGMGGRGRAGGVGRGGAGLAGAGLAGAGTDRPRRWLARGLTGSRPLGAGCTRLWSLVGSEAVDTASLGPALGGRWRARVLRLVQPAGQQRADDRGPLRGTWLDPAHPGRPPHPQPPGVLAGHRDGDQRCVAEPGDVLLARAGQHVRGVPPHVPHRARPVRDSTAGTGWDSTAG